MVKDFIHKVKYGNLFLAVEHSNINGEDCYFCLGTSFKKGELEFAFAKAETSLNNVFQNLKKERQVYLIINNDKVLENIITKEDKSNLELVGQAFPDTKLDEFYYELLHTNDQSLVAICRKSVVDDLIAVYQKNGIHVIGWSIGISALGQLKDYLKEGNYVIPTYGFNVENAQISTLKHSRAVAESKQYHIEGITLDGEYLLALAGATRSLTNYNSNEDLSYSLELEESQIEYVQHQYFRKGKLLAVFLLLIIALGNLFIFENYSNKVKEIEVKSAISKQQQANVAQRAKEVNEKQKLFEDVVGSTSSTVSLYVDQILNDIPESISLEKLSYQPILKKIRVNKPIELKEDEIELSGQAIDKEDLARWVSRLEDMEFVRNVEMRLEKLKRDEVFTLSIMLE